MLSDIKRQTRQTFDLDAQELNQLMNPVLHRIRCGHALRKIIDETFAGDTAQFRAWARIHLDPSEQSLARYLTIAAHEDDLINAGLISLVDCYRALDVEKDSLYKIQ